eukprot:gene36630-49363_t
MRQYAYRGRFDVPLQPWARNRHMTMSGLDKWYAYMTTHDHAALWDLLHPDVVFESPVVHTPQRGRDITFKYLSSAEKVLGGPGFAYRGEWRSETGAVLEFENEIEGITINGVDIITFDADGRIIHFKVMVRPLKAVNMLHRMMGEQLTKLGTADGGAKPQTLLLHGMNSPRGVPT